MNEENGNGQKTYTMIIDEDFDNMVKVIKDRFNLTSRRAAIFRAVRALNVIIEKKAKIISKDRKTEIVIV